MCEWLILHTAAVGLLAGAAALLGRRLAPAARHVLWLVVLVKLLTPPVLIWPWGLPAPFEAASPPAAQQGDVEAAEADTAPALIVVLPAADTPPPLLAVDQAALPAAAATAQAGRPPWEDWLLHSALLLWIAGGLVMAVLHGVRIVALRRRLGAALAVPPRLSAEVAQAAAKLGVRAPAIRVLTGLASPMLCGWGSPQLLWPEGLEQELDTDGQRAVLIHELAHLSRRDHWTAWLVLMGACVWWWHPLYWLVRGQLAREAELACDAWVVATMPHGRRAYAEALLAVALRGSWTAGLAPALGAAGSRRDLERRLIMIMRERPVCRLSLAVAAAAVALAVLGLPAWTLQSFGQQPAAVAPVDPVVSQSQAPLPTVAAVPAQQPVATDKKLREMEEKIHELLKELRDLRGNSPLPVPPIPPTMMPPAMQRGQPNYYEPVTSIQQSKPVTSYQFVVPLAQAGNVNEMTLSRVSYKLTPGKAEALSKLLNEHVKGIVLETKVDGDTITVTTTPETQRMIAQFQTLLRGKAEKPANSNGAVR
jgi:beta-lactamase regulating signal transducer with metallopeptidase domain